MHYGRWQYDINDDKCGCCYINVVVNAIVSTTTYYPVVEKLTTGNCMWSLIVLTTEPLTTMDDHIFVVVKNF
jgi:hypothetical protein